MIRQCNAYQYKFKIHAYFQLRRSFARSLRKRFNDMATSLFGSHITEQFNWMNHKLAQFVTCCTLQYVESPVDCLMTSQNRNTEWVIREASYVDVICCKLFHSHSLPPPLLRAQPVSCHCKPALLPTDRHAARINRRPAIQFVIHRLQWMTDWLTDPLPAPDRHLLKTTTNSTMNSRVFLVAELNYGPCRPWLNRGRRSVDWYHWWLRGWNLSI